MTRIGSNKGEYPSFTGSPITLPSALSNSAAIQAGDIGILEIASSDAANDLQVAGWTRRIQNGDDLGNTGSGAAFTREMTGTEAAGWVLTFVESSTSLDYAFAVYRGVAIESVASAGIFDDHVTAGGTATDATLAVLAAVNLPNIPLALYNSPPSGVSTTVEHSTHSVGAFEGYVWETAVTAGSVNFTATLVTNAGSLGLLLVLLKPASVGLHLEAYTSHSFID